ncbi:MAG: RNA polymerase subunit sigma [Sandaracinus sp.]|nr:RNA polymerase subunit sigma [Sandaracinus sp.]
MPEGHEEELVARLKRRDEAAFNELVELYQGRIYRLVFRMLGDRAEAEDLAQEVFVTVFKRIDGFRGDSKLSTWMYRVATNHCKNRLKFLGRRGRGQKRELDEIADAHAIESATMSTSAQLPRPDDVLLGRQVEGFIGQALRELNEEQRTLVVLRDIENLTYDEIQDVTGLPAGTVKSRLHRARLALAERVRELRASGTMDEEGS